MKPQIYLRLSLLLPYLLWAVMLLLALTYDGENLSSTETTMPFIVGWLASLYVFGVIFWFVPYALLALGLLIWSIHKQVNTTLRVFAVSPLILTILILLEINVLSIATGGLASYLSTPDFENLMALNELTVVLTLAGGYLCVGIAFGLYKILQYLKVIKETSPEFQPIITEAS